MSAGRDGDLRGAETTDRTRLERRYELLLRSYPARYRAAHGAEIVGTLLEASESRRRLPAPREAFGLVRGGLAARARAAGDRPGPWWLDGLHLGVFLLALANLVSAVRGFNGIGDAWWLACSAGTAIALLRGRPLVAAPFAALLCYQVYRPYVRLPEVVNDLIPYSGPTYAITVQWQPSLPFWVLASGVAVLLLAAAASPGRLRPRSGWWLAPLVPALAYGAASDALLVDPAAATQVWVGITAAAVGALLLAGIRVAAATRDPRWALAAAVSVLPDQFAAFEHLPAPVLSGYLAALCGLVVMMAAAGAPGRVPGAGDAGRAW
ncbi:hypothetical protein [Streptomonospora litoralis]|uniref:Uncharacterized protein n=1 Tax=Streptomonospora litoralis TaxID=2498135 RepID=A0A4P6PZ28_9ACTN|nr:hypothetical protein [Streptomonospora litoralis]QBI53566.1 hypothetical protein EKD16_08860 [Streptomonospora litoralis]